MGTRTALKRVSIARARVAVGLGCLTWGAAIVLSTLLGAGVPARESLERTRGTVETLEASGGAVHFTLAGQALRLRYVGRGGDLQDVRRLLEEARSAQVVLLFDGSSGIVYELDGASGARRYEQVREAWQDTNGTRVGLGLALTFVGASLAFGRPRRTGG